MYAYISIYTHINSCIKIKPQNKECAASQGTEPFPPPSNPPQTPLKPPSPPPPRPRLHGRAQCRQLLPWLDAMPSGCPWEKKRTGIRWFFGWLTLKGFPSKKKRGKKARLRNWVQGKAEWGTLQASLVMVMGGKYW